jgi:cobalt-zinc-cadmium efflux system outer membrane protein
VGSPFTYVAVLAGLLQVSCATSGALPSDPGAVSTAIAARASGGSLPPEVNLQDGVSVEEAVASALWTNPWFQLTLADLGFARADLIEARMLRNPALSLLFPLGPKQLEATVSFPIDALIHRPRRVRAASLDYDAVAARLVADGVRLVADVKTAYVAVAAAERRAEVARETATVAGRVRTIAGARLKAGDISDMEARATRGEALVAETTATAAEHDRDLALVRLRAIIGAAPEAIIRVTPLRDLALQSCGDVDALVKQALAARPDVRAAELAIEAAGARAGLAKAEAWTLTAILDANGDGREGFEMGPGLAGELPILGQNQGRRARAAAQLDQATRRYTALRASIAEELAMAMTRLARARSLLALWDEAARGALETELRQVERAYDAGELPLLSVLDTARRVMTVRAGIVSAQADLLDAGVAVDRALGRSCMVK